MKNQSDIENKPIQTENLCFYELCTKEKACGDRITCGRFRDRNHAVLCGLFCLLLTLLFITIIFPMVIYALVDDGINSQVVIDSTSAPNYEAWQTNTAGSGFDDVKIAYKLYFFDLQNEAETLNGQKPMLVEVGPYYYHEYYNKFDITWTDDGDTVTYNNQRFYVFDASMSGPGLTDRDNLTLTYPTVTGFQYLLASLSPQEQQAFDYALIGGIKMKEIAIEHQITEAYDSLGFVLRHKYGPSLIAQNNTIKAYFNSIYSFILSANAGDLMLKTLLCNGPNGISPFWKVNPSNAWFGWLQDPILVMVGNLLAMMPPNPNATAWNTAVPGAAYNYTSIADARRRRTPDTLKTGKKNKNQVSQYVHYFNMSLMHTCILPMNSNNMTNFDPATEFPACAHYQTDWTEEQAEKAGYSLPFATDYANRIQGTDANMFGRPVTSEKLQVFISDIYRSAYLINMHDDQDWYGVTLRRFGLQLKDVENATVNPENAQYYAFGPSGLLNATAASGIPVFISFPHFLNGDARLLEAVTGLHPVKSEHQSYLDVEPQTGLLAQARKRLQVNYLLNDLALPVMQEDTISTGKEICYNLTQTFEKIENSSLPINGTLPTLQCENSLLGPGIECWVQPSTWKFTNNGNLYMPYGWVSEELDLPESDANSLSDSLFIMDTVADNLRFWGLIASGITFAVMCGWIWYMYLAHKQGLARWDAYKYHRDVNDPLQQSLTNDSTHETTNMLHTERVE